MKKFMAAVAGLSCSLLLTLPGTAQADEAGCGTTWTTACASVSISYSGNSLTMGLTNVSHGADAENSVLTRLFVDVAGENEMASFDVFADCDDSGIVDGDHCTEITSYWRETSGNNSKRFGLEIDDGVESRNGVCQGVVVDGLGLPCTESGNQQHWSGDVFFVMNFEDEVEEPIHWATLAQNLGPDGEGSEPITAVPEPMTTSMLALGLLGWAGARARRRRDV